MTIIQLFLLLALLILAILHFQYTSLKIHFKLLILLIAFLGIFAVLFPDYTTKIANFVGVGRGVDLIFYLFIIFFIFALYFINKSILTIKKNQAKIIEEIAILKAEKLNKK